MNPENGVAYFLRTARLGFRPWQHDDLPLAIALWGDPEVTRFIDTRGRLSETQIQELLDKHISTQCEFGIQYWPIFLLETGEFVACCGLRPYDQAKRVHELGVHIRSEFWRRGFAKEAASAVIDYAFGTLGVAALFAGHNPNNMPSRRLLEKLGFQYTHDEYYPPTGLKHPSYLLRPALADNKKHRA